MPRGRWILVVMALVFSVLPVPVHSMTWNNPAQLTSDSITHAQPKISLDGTKITYLANPLPYRDWQIFVINTDGTGAKQLTNTTASSLVPSINGNGSLIAFYADTDGNFEIYKVKSDGTGLTQLTSTSTVVNTYPAISGDGSRVAFQSNRTGNLEIYSMYTNGSGLRQLTFNNALDEHASTTSNGSLIVFDSNVMGNREIFIANSDGTGVRQLTFNANDNVDPVISGDGKYVAYQSNSTGHYEIWLVRTDGSGPRQLSFDPGDDLFPSINYDGSLVAYEGSVKGYKQIMVAQTGSSQIDQLTFDQANHFLPSIDGAGANIAYQSDASGFTQLFLVNRVNYDVSVVGMTVSRNFAYSGIPAAQPIKINVTVANFSPIAETINVTAKANATAIGIQTVTLPSKGTLSVTFGWNTTGFARGNYTVTGEASQVSGEIDLYNNAMVMSGFEQVRKGGDVTGDRLVDLNDLIAVFVHMFTTSLPSYYDLNNDGKVDLNDLIITWQREFT